jgi:hypothetical protein
MPPKKKDELKRTILPNFSEILPLSLASGNPFWSHRVFTDEEMQKTTEFFTTYEKELQAVLTTDLNTNVLQI